MDRKYAEEVISQEIMQIAGEAAVTEENALLKEDCGLDSLSLVALIVGLEDRLGIRFEDAELDPEKILRVGDLAELVCRHA